MDDAERVSVLIEFKVFSILLVSLHSSVGYFTPLF
jgi:hypothetical protein